MEFNEKLQELRKKRGLTQEELAKSLYVSRTAISKWELGKGYPTIDSIKDIAKFFGVTVDELLSNNQLLAVAEEDKRRTKKRFNDLVFGFLDICVALLFILPLLAVRNEEGIQSVSIINFYTTQTYIKFTYVVAVLLIVFLGVFTLALQNYNNVIWLKGKTLSSLTLGALLVVTFIISLQPYAAVFTFVLLTIKTLIFIKQGHESCR